MTEAQIIEHIILPVKKYGFDNNLESVRTNLCIRLTRLTFQLQLSTSAIGQTENTNANGQGRYGSLQLV